MTKSFIVWLVAALVGAGCVTPGTIVDTAGFAVSDSLNVTRDLPGGVRFRHPRELKLFEVRKGQWLLGYDAKRTSAQIELMFEEFDGETPDQVAKRRRDFLTNLGGVEETRTTSNGQIIRFSIGSLRTNKRRTVIGSMHGFEIIQGNKWFSVYIFKRHRAVPFNEWDPGSLFTAADRNFVKMIAESVKFDGNNRVIAMGNAGKD